MREKVEASQRSSTEEREVARRENQMQLVMESSKGKEKRKEVFD